MMSVVISMSIHTAHTSTEKMQRLFMPASYDMELIMSTSAMFRKSIAVGDMDMPRTGTVCRM